MGRVNVRSKDRFTLPLTRQGIDAEQDYNTVEILSRICASR
jgi:hypothetical protein